MNKKIVFWQSELGCTLAQGHKVGTRRSFSVTSSYKKKSNDNARGGNGRNNEDVKNSTSKKTGYSFCGDKGHVSLFNCGGFKNANMTARCHFVVSHRLCWRCLEEGHVARGYPDKKIN